MKKLMTAAFLFASAFAFAEGYEDWFTPPDKWVGVKAPVKLVVNVDGAPVTIDFNMNINNTLNVVLRMIDNATAGLPESAKNAFKVSRLALANSLYASCQAHMNKLKIDNLGAALEGVFVSTYGQYVDEQGNVLSKSKSGVDTSKLRQQLLANKNAVVIGGQAAGGSENNPLTIVVTQKPYDEQQFEQHIQSGRSLTSLHGWYNLADAKTSGTDGAYGWAFGYKHYFIPFSNGKSSTLGWMKWNGWDTGCFSTGDDVDGGQNNQPLRLHGWTTANNCSKSIQNLLTNETLTVDRSRHKILTRYDDGHGATIHWMKFDESVIGGSEGHADDKSIVLTQDEDASSEDPKKFRLKGFDEAVDYADVSDGATLPFVDATSDELQWGSIMDFFADSVFRQSSETGKILLNGTSEEGKVKVLAMTGSGGDDQTITALTFDNSSIDGNPAVGGVVQLHGFDVAPSPYESGDVSFADVLTNTTTQITGMSVPVRVPEQGAPAGYAVKYVPMGKITGIPSAAVDDKTIEINETDPQNPYLQLRGAAGEGITLEEGDVYQIGDDGKGEFAKLGGDAEDEEVTAENASIETYTGEDGGKYFRLWDWMINREGVPHVLGWNEHALEYWETRGYGGIEVYGESANKSLQLTGHNDAAEGAIPYAKKDGNGLGWLAGVDDRVPLLHNNGAPTTMAIGASLDKANVSAVPTLNVKGFTAGGNCTAKLNKMLSDPSETSNRSAHQFMARYSNGGDPSVHWVSIDGVVGGGSPVDNTSITTNYSAGASADGTASLYGFRTANEGDVPHKKSDGTIEWKAAGGGAPVDDASITTNTVNGAVTSGNASIYGFADAPAGTVPMVINDNGTRKLGWGTTGNFGITATKSNGSWTYTVSGGYFTSARSQTYVSGITVSSSGYVYLKVPLGTGSSATVVLESSSKSSDSTDTYILLYYCNVSTGVSDYRGAPHIQVWE